MPLSRDELNQFLIKKGFEPHVPRNRSWKLALTYANDTSSMYFLFRKNGVDVYWHSDKSILEHDEVGRLYCEGGELFRNHYSKDGPTIHNLIAALATQYSERGVFNARLLNDHGESYKQKARQREAEEGGLKSLFQSLVMDDDEPIYMSDGMWLMPDGSLEDRGR